MFAPRFHITPAIARSLMQIEAHREVVTGLPIDVAVLNGLRETARIASTHHSTAIEGNRLTEPEVRRVLAGARFPGQERDEREVRNYYRALEWVEARATGGAPLGIVDIRRLHGLAFRGSNRPSAWRDGQNVIREGATGRIVYLPPEARDVPGLVADLVDWIAASLDAAELPIPIVAGLAHYELATIHPWYDGNGRTARLFATLLLHQAGYGLRGIYSLDEYYARDLGAYYAALTVGPSHNYYEGRAAADLTGFVAYFCAGMADAFAKVRIAATAAQARTAADRADRLQLLDPRRRRLLQLFVRRDTVTAAEIARHLGLETRTVVALCRGWVADGFLALADSSRRNRAYRLASQHRDLLPRGQHRPAV